MLMRMLEAGGVEVYSDGERNSDQDNPHGYFEHESIKALANDNSWLHDAEGKAIKIIAHLLKYIPSDLCAKVLFVERPIEEVLMSQQKMIDRLGTKAPTAPAETLKKVFQKQVATIKQEIETNSNLEVLYLNYHDAIKNPSIMCNQIVEFLMLDLETEAMANAIDPTLYRNKC